jgi:sulfatase maturation enzyme AslB (radical SAM superfamily)
MKHICSIPWTGFSNEPDGRVQPCCLYKGYIEEDGKQLYIQTHSVNEIFHSKFMKDLREQFRRGENPAGCSVCWTDEDNGYDSKRIIYNTKIHNKFDLDFTAEPEHITEFQLIINNSCNLKCRSCTPSHSSQWQQEIKVLTGSTGYAMPYGQSANETSKLWIERFDWYKNLKRLEVVGGEPFYVKQWHTMFNELIDLGYSKNIDITMTTNCTLFFPELVEKLAKNFKSVSIGLSIDGTGSVYEYIRHPGKWDIVYENMKRYYAYVEKINVQVNITISLLNALEIPKLHNLIYKEFPKFKIWNNLVHTPLHLPLWATPVEFKQDVESLWNSFKWKTEYADTMASILGFMNSKDINKEIFDSNLEILYKTDKFRNETLSESIPEIKIYLPS